MTEFQALVLGLIQGLSEFLPISSSAHLALTPWFLGWESGGLAFDVALHIGTLVAVAWYFRREWLALAQSGFLFQGQYYPWQSGTRGAPALDRPSHQFIAFIENHDQVANLSSGLRVIDVTSPSWWRAMSAFLLLGPWTPLLFQG